MLIFLISFIISAVTLFIIYRFNPLLGFLISDPVNTGPQKIHTKPVPRIGGVGVFIALIGSNLLIGFGNMESCFLLIASIPAFIGGLIEDLTKRFGVFLRLFFTMLSASIGVYLLGALIVRIDIPYIDYLLSSPSIFSLIFAYTFTLFSVGGIANAINIIDGFNGIAGMISLITFLALGYISYLVGDLFIFHVCLAVSGAVMGFLVWNYPNGLIFLGDGGAYLLGFLIAEISVLLVNRHPEVSPWFPMMLVVYPFTETIYSIYRRKFLKNRPTYLPDALHLHTLIYRRIVRLMSDSNQLECRVKLNSMTAPYLWILSLMSVIPAILFWQNTVVLICLVITFIWFYIWLYGRLVQFKAPKYLFRKLIGRYFKL